MSFPCSFGSGSLKSPPSACQISTWPGPGVTGHTGASPYTGPFLVLRGGGPERHAAQPPRPWCGSLAPDGGGGDYIADPGSSPVQA